MQGEYIAPQSDLEQQIAAIWADVLKLERVGLSENFFQLGGHSLLATQAVARLQMELGADTPLALIFQTDNLRDYAAAVTAAITECTADLDEFHDFMNELEAV